MKFSTFEYVAVMFSMFFAGVLHGPHHHLSNAQSDDFLYMGSSWAKQYYITKDYLNDDFVHALRYICPTYNMELATVDNDDEFRVIDSWYRTNYPNTTATSPYVKGWTSAIAMQAIPLTWATNNKAADLSRNTVVYAGTGQGGDYYWSTCISVYHRCNRPQGSPDGCWPLETVYAYTDCREKNRIICQKRYYIH